MPVISPEELTDMFMDFEGSVGAVEPRRDMGRLPPPQVIDAA